MKLAEALARRSTLQRRIISLRERAGTNALVQEGNDPHEHPENLIRQAEEALSELESLVVRISRTNTENTLSDGRTLAEAVAHRDTLKQRNAFLIHVAERAEQPLNRMGFHEIRFLTTVSVGDVRARAEAAAEEWRVLNAQIQERNWQVDLV